MRNFYRFLFTAAILGGVSQAMGSFLITHAWHLTFSGASATGNSNPMVFDASGNFYFQYITGGNLHLKKLSPAEDPYFDVSVASVSSLPQGYAPLAISPKVLGTQYIYLSWTTSDLGGNPVANIAK